MSRCPVEVQFADVRGEHLRIALATQMMRNERLEFFSDDGAPRCPQNQALTNLFVDVEELQIFAEFSVVPFLGLLHAVKGGFQRFFGRLDKAVDANELFPVLIAPPVG